MEAHDKLKSCLRVFSQRERDRRNNVLFIGQQLSTLSSLLKAVEDGNFSVRMPIAVDGLAREVARRFNNVVARNQAMTQEIERVSVAVGREGRLTERNLSDWWKRGGYKT